MALPRSRIRRRPAHCERTGPGRHAPSPDLRKQFARYIDHADERTIARHVNAVIILRAEIQRGEASIHELGGKDRITSQQCRGRILVALCLKNLIALDRTKLTDSAINRANVIRLCEWADACAQGACEKIIKASVAADVRISRFSHVDAIAADEPADQTCRQAPSPGARDFSADCRKRLLRQQILK